MGSFDASCFFSRLSIKWNDECLVIASVKNKYGDRGGSMNDGPYQFFEPALLPIRGKYNDYGTLEDVVEDHNTKALEKHFNKDIHAIVDDICRGAIDGDFYPCFMRQDVYDAIVERGKKNKEKAETFNKEKIDFLKRMEEEKESAKEMKSLEEELKKAVLKIGDNEKNNPNDIVTLQLQVELAKLKGFLDSGGLTLDKNKISKHAWLWHFCSNNRDQNFKEIYTDMGIFEKEVSEWSAITAAC